jgi:hypothetical protein
MSERRYWYAMNACIKSSERPCGGCEDRDEQIAELRAILAPLLDDPIKNETCQFCGAEIREAYMAYGPYRFPDGQVLDLGPRRIPSQGEHAPNCPVLRKDALLGVQGGH